MLNCDAKYCDSWSTRREGVIERGAMEGVMEREPMTAVTCVLASAVDRLEYLMHFLVA